MATNYTKTVGNENFAGLCRIYVEPYRDLMWKVLIDKVPISTLIVEIKKVLANAHRLLLFHHKFKQLLDIYNSKGTIENTDCDISVLYSLFRNIPTGLEHPSKDWGPTPGFGHHRVTDDVERIHHGRNTVTGHAGTFSISDAEFTAQLDDMVAVVKRIDSSFVPHLMQIKSDCLSSKGHLQHYHIYIEELERQMTVEAELKKRVDDIESVSSDNTRRLDDQDVRIHALEATHIAAEQQHQVAKRTDDRNPGNGALGPHGPDNSMDDRLLDAFEFDILILHADNDNSDAYSFGSHLMKECRADKLKVITWAGYCPGKSMLRGMEDVFSKARYIFVYVTDNLTKDDFVRLIQEASIIDSFTDPVKKWRIVPVQTTQMKINIFELNSLCGLNYSCWMHGTHTLKQSYLTTLQQLIRRGRKDIQIPKPSLPSGNRMVSGGSDDAYFSD